MEDHVELVLLDQLSKACVLVRQVDLHVVTLQSIEQIANLTIHFYRIWICFEI